MKSILSTQEAGWFIKRINEPTIAQTFKGEVRQFDHYYRIYDAHGQQIKYCKFQQLDRLASVLHVDVDELPLIK